MVELHSLLKRQIRKCFGDPFDVPAEWQGFIQAVDGAYREFDVDRNTLERAFEISSQELNQDAAQLAKVREIALGIESRTRLDDLISFVVESARNIQGIRFILALKIDESQQNAIMSYHSRIQTSPKWELLKILGFDIKSYFDNTSSKGSLKIPVAKLKAGRDFLKNTRTISVNRISDLMGEMWPKLMCDSLQKITGDQRWVIVPLLVEGKLWGCLLFMLDKYVPQTILEMIAAHCALGIKNVLVLESLQNRNTELATANNVIRQASDNIEAQKDLIDRILATTPNANMVIDKDSKIVLANRALCETVRKKAVELTAKPVSEILPVEELFQAISKARSGDLSNLTHEFRYRLNNDERIFVANILQMGQDELLITLNDVTEERARQERLYLTDRLASVGEMAAGIAHELNNPLTGVVGLSQLLINEELPDEAKEDLKAICDEAQRAATIVKNLLTFARKHTPTNSEVHLHAVIEDVLKLRAYEHKINNIRVATQFDNELPPIMADRFQIQQVFLNIILNAEQAMVETHNKGTLTIITGRSDNNVKVSISDDGPGISPDNIRKLFSPFFTTKDVGKGTGLGLSICYGIITNHGGRIHAHSEADKGATFVVELPINGTGKINSPG